MCNAGDQVASLNQHLARALQSQTKLSAKLQH